MEAREAIRNIEESASLPWGKGDRIAGYGWSGFRFDPDMCNVRTPRLQILFGLEGARNGWHRELDLSFRLGSLKATSAAPVPAVEAHTCGFNPHWSTYKGLQLRRAISIQHD